MPLERRPQHNSTLANQPQNFQRPVRHPGGGQRSAGLNPYDAPQIALERGRQAIQRMQTLQLLSNEATANALGESRYPGSASHYASTCRGIHQPAPHPNGFQIPLARIERGGLTVISTLDYDLQRKASCVTAFYAARVAGLPDPIIECDSLRFPPLPPGIRVPDLSASAVIIDPRTGQVLAAVGETFQAQETPLFRGTQARVHAGCVCLFSRVHTWLEPCATLWDIPGRTDVQKL